MNVLKVIEFLVVFLAGATVAAVLYGVIALLVSYMRDEE